MQVLDRASFRILHVEDDIDFAWLGKTFLERAGFIYPVTHYTNGHLALDDLRLIHRDLAPHVVLLDLHMPAIGGIEVLQQIRSMQSQRSLAVFLLSSSREPADIRRAMAQGATKYFIKNYSFKEVIENFDLLIRQLNARVMYDQPSDVDAVPA